MIGKNENLVKFCWSVLLVFVLWISSTLFSSFNTTADNIEKGKQALEKVTIVEIELDSLQKSCAKKSQEDELFKQGITITNNAILQTLIELKGGQERLENLHMKK